MRVRTPVQKLTAGEYESGRLTRWRWPAAIALAIVVLFLCYLRLSNTYPDNSDGADQALQAWDMLHGNWLLQGWTIGDVSYYTTELPEYIGVELIRGLGPAAVHVAGALTYMLLTLLVALLAKGRATGREGVVRALVASGILLAPQFGSGIHFLLNQPDHLGTQVPLLIIFIVLDRAPRRWYVPVAVGAMLTWVLISDRVALFDGALAIAAVCGIRALWSVARDRKPLTSQRFEFSLVAAALVSIGVSTLVARAITRLHGYTMLPMVVGGLARPQTIPAHVVLTIDGILNVYGADFIGISPENAFGPASGGLPMGVAVAVALVHLVGVALALCGVCLAFRRFFSVGDLIAPMLATAIVLNLAAYIATVAPVTLFDTRQILVVLPFGAVLAGRMLAGPLSRARLKPALTVVLACYLAALCYGVAQPTVRDSEQAIVPWLEAHHLSTGLGTYTEANLITLDSGGRVAIRTVSWRITGAVPRDYESKASWYDPRISYANFVVSNTADSNGVSVVPQRDILALAGPPAHTYHYKTFTVMVWNKNLLTDLGSPPSSTPGNIP